jgi:hypothetical protein
MDSIVTKRFGVRRLNTSKGPNTYPESSRTGPVYMTLSMPAMFWCMDESVTHRIWRGP